MKKYKWFPTAKSYSIMIYNAVGLMFLLLTTIVFFVQWYIKILIFVLLVFLLIMLSVVDKKLYPIFIKLEGKYVKIHYFLLNKKKLEKEKINIYLTEIAFLFDLYHTGDYIRVSPKSKSLKIKN